MSPEMKEKFKQIVAREIISNGDTNIAKGLIDGFDLLLNRRHVNDITSVFFLSDGQDTCGNTFPTFETLLKENDAKMAAKGMDYKINSFGYGSGHDENVLGLISSFKNGKFYYIKNNQLVDECFIECLGYLMTFFAKQAEITVFLNGSVRFLNKYGAAWSQEFSPNKATIKVGGIAAGLEKNFVAEIEVPAAKAGTVLQVASAILNFVAQDKGYTVQAELALPSTADDNLGEINKKVEENFVRIQAAEILKEAKQDYDKGDVVLAKAKVATFKRAQEQNINLAPAYAQNLNLMMDEEEVFDAKVMKNAKEALEEQVYKPGFANIYSMNSGQEKMQAKRKK